MMKRLTVILAIIIIGATASHAQGISFEPGQNWGEVLSKAKTEHKYIFIDCYASWCGPCKAMAADIFPLKEVGEAYNKAFISIKMRMDLPQPPDSEDGNSINWIWYRNIKDIEEQYSINGYPAFMFLDPNGKPVHKVIGYLDKAAFIQLAADAQNPDKQYYTIVKNFRPNTLDTADEKGLIRLFANSDTALAGRIAQDYLTRIPTNQLNIRGTRYLMVQFQHIPAVLAIAENYIQKLPKADLPKEGNAYLIEALHKYPQFNAVAQAYIKDLSEKELYNKNVIEFVAHFTETTDDKKGFSLFYLHSARVNAVMGQKGYAEGEARRIITNTLVEPSIKTTKKVNITPNFDSLQNVVAKKYGAKYAKDLMYGPKMGWYQYLVFNKNQSKYWPNFIAAKIAAYQRFRIDTIYNADGGLNSICWAFFQHGTDKRQLLIAAGWMKEVNEKHPNYSTYIDTYACLLYKAGLVDFAIRTETLALQVEKKDSPNGQQFVYLQNTIDKMKKGEPIWDEKEYQ